MIIRRLFLSFLMSVVCTFFCSAKESIDVDNRGTVQQNIYKQSQAVAESHMSKLDKMTQGSGGVERFEDVLLGKVDIKNKAEDLGQLPIEGEKLKEDIKEKEAEIKCAIDGCNVANAMGTKAMHEREAKLEALGFKKDKDQFPEDNKGAIDKANYNAKKFIETFGAITGSYKDCKHIENSRSHKEETECDEYYDIKYKNCPISQVVEIDPKYTYQCNKKRNDAIKTCHDEIVSIKCKDSADCDNGGIIAADLSSDMQFTYSYPNLLIGARENNIWSDGIYDRTTKLVVKNLDKIKEFRIIRVEFDDHMWIKVNGHSVFIGPYGGNELEPFVGGVTNGQQQMSYELGVSWQQDVNIDLKPYLKEGTNEIWTRVVVGGFGEGWMHIKASQHCCKDWDIKRKQTCKYEGAS